MDNPTEYVELPGSEASRPADCDRSKFSTANGA